MIHVLTDKYFSYANGESTQRKKNRNKEKRKKEKGQSQSNTMSFFQMIVKNAFSSF